MSLELPALEAASALAPEYYTREDIYAFELREILGRSWQLLAGAEALARHATSRFGRPEDIASIAVWLASDEASFATGQLFTIDGGMTAASPVNPGLH